jgi:hypothetical protein
VKAATPESAPVLALEPLCHRAGTRIVYDTARPGGLACECATCRRILFRVPVEAVGADGLAALTIRRHLDR